MSSTVNKIKEAIKTKIRPILVMDGGNIEFVDYNDGIVSVKLLGACNGCPLSNITLKNTVERLLRERVPEIKEVLAIDSDDDTMERF